MIRPTMLMVAALLGTAMPAFAAAPDGPNYAQHLVDQIVAAHPDVVVLAVHATPPGSTQNVIIASNIGRIGKVADPDDMRVINTGKPNLAVNKAGDRYEVELPLYDASHRLLGALGTVFAYKAGADTAAMQAEATAIRDYMGRRISHAKNLNEPYRFDTTTAPGNYSQAVLDELFDAHPELAILAVHVTPPRRPDTENVISASSIGRIGKLADEDDLAVIRTGKEKLELNETRDRFENEMALHDKRGRIIGALGVVYPYPHGADQQALSRQAHMILAAYEARTGSAAQLLGPAHGGAAAIAGTSPLSIVGRTNLPGYTGDFDHFEADVTGNRLFLAAEDHGTLEVFNLTTGALQHTVKGSIETPHSVLYMPAAHKLLVTDSGKNGLSHYFDSRSFAPAGDMKLVPGADSVGWDAPRGRLYIVTGGKDVDMKDSWLEEIDPSTGKHYSRIHFDANHVEAMAVEQHGPRIWINVTDKNRVDVIDKRSAKVIKSWPVTAAEQNCCFAFDEPGHRMFMVTRKPGKILVLNSDTGTTLATFDAPARIDQIIWDAKRHRAYAMGGEGWISIIGELDPQHFVELPRLITAPGAKTGILVPERNEMFVAVSPGESKAMAQVLRIKVGN